MYFPDVNGMFRMNYSSANRETPRQQRSKVSNSQITNARTASEETGGHNEKKRIGLGDLRCKGSSGGLGGRSSVLIAPDLRAP